MHDFDGTNPLLEALGDEPEIKEITLTNSSAFIIVEPLTQVRLQPLDKTVIRVKGNAAYEQIIAISVLTESLLCQYWIICEISFEYWLISR